MISINWLRLSLFKIDLGIPVDLADAHRIDARCPETFDLDKRRGMAAQKATAPLSMRRALRVRTLPASAQKSSW